jgi:hypothetical protein
MWWILAAVGALIMAAAKAAGGPLKNIFDPPEDVARVIRVAAAKTGQSEVLLKAVMFVESRFRPDAVNNANPNNPSIGLGQIRPVPWLRYFGFDAVADRERLYEAPFNAEKTAEILTYFQRRGFQFPAQADVYNLGETEFNKGVRNDDYRAKVEQAFAWFSTKT